MKILYLRQKNKDAFDEWIENIECLNNLLVRYTLKLNENGRTKNIEFDIFASHFLWLKMSRSILPKPF